MTNKLYSESLIDLNNEYYDLEDAHQNPEKRREITKFLNELLVTPGFENLKYPVYDEHYDVSKNEFERAFNKQISDKGIVIGNRDNYLMFKLWVDVNEDYIISQKKASKNKSKKASKNKSKKASKNKSKKANKNKSKSKTAITSKDLLKMADRLDALYDAPEGNEKAIKAIEDYFDEIYTSSDPDIADKSEDEQVKSYEKQMKKMGIKVLPEDEDTIWTNWVDANF